MKLFEIQNSKYTIYVDLDGVLADLYGEIYNITGHWMIHDDDGVDAPAWNQINEYRKKGNRLFENLNLLPDAMVLWNYVKKYNPHILTALGKVMTEQTDEEKRKWVRKNLTGYDQIYTVKFSKMKANYASPTSILIDDRMRSIGPWRKAGGVGILHENAVDTIRQLKELDV